MWSMDLVSVVSMTTSSGKPCSLHLATSCLACSVERSDVKLEGLPRDFAAIFLTRDLAWRRSQSLTSVSTSLSQILNRRAPGRPLS